MFENGMEVQWNHKCLTGCTVKTVYTIYAQCYPFLNPVTYNNEVIINCWHVW